MTIDEGAKRQGVMSYPFAGVPTFLRAPLRTSTTQLDAHIAVVGIPTDVGSPFQPGSRFGPRGIREHSLRFDSRGFYDGRDDTEYLVYELENELVADVGDIDVVPTDVEGTWDRITESIRAVRRVGALPVILGGDHAITAPVVRAWDTPVHIFHFDAHIDYSPFRHGFQYTNTHPMRYVHEMPNVSSITQVGIRSLRNRMADVHDSRDDGNRVISVEEYRDLRPEALVEHLPANAEVYVSIDIDVLDMSLVPGCVSAEPDGMTYNELRTTLTALSEHADVVGLDLVEVNPLLDIGTGITSYLAAHTIVEFLGHICAQPRWIQRRTERPMFDHAQATKVGPTGTDAQRGVG